MRFFFPLHFFFFVSFFLLILPFKSIFMCGSWFGWRTLYTHLYVGYISRQTINSRRERERKKRINWVLFTLLCALEHICIHLMPNRNWRATAKDSERRIENLQIHIRHAKMRYLYIQFIFLWSHVSIAILWLCARASSVYSAQQSYITKNIAISRG